MQIKQFKLTNDDEIVCEVVSYDRDGSLVVNNAIRILQFEDPQRGVRGYYFRPFMTFQDDNELRINSMHIICELDPTEEMVMHYKDQVDDIIKNVTRTTADREVPSEEFKEALRDFLKDDTSEPTHTNTKKIVH